MDPSTLVVVNSQRLLFDAGRGATIRLWRMRMPIGALDATFLTHFHSDRTNGLPDVGSRLAPFHTTPDAAGRIFSEARPKLAVYTHIVLANKDNPLDKIRPIEAADQQWQVR